MTIIELRCMYMYITRMLIHVCVCVIIVTAAVDTIRIRDKVSHTITIIQYTLVFYIYEHYIIMTILYTILTIYITLCVCVKVGTLPSTATSPL